MMLLTLFFFLFLNSHNTVHQLCYNWLRLSFSQPLLLLDSFNISSNRHRYNTEFCKWWCSRGWWCLSEPQIVRWVNWTLITGQGICLLPVYIPVMQEMSREMHFKSSDWCKWAYWTSTWRYRACVMWRHLPSVPEVLLQAQIWVCNCWNIAANSRLHCTHFVLYNFYLILINFPRHFLIFYGPFASHAYAILFYCHSYVWMIWNTTSVGSLTVQIKRFSSFAIFPLVVCLCLFNYFNNKYAVESIKVLIVKVDHCFMICFYCDSPTWTFHFRVTWLILSDASSTS